MPLQAQRGGRGIHPIFNPALEGGGWSAPCFICITLGKAKYLLYRMLTGLDDTENLIVLGI
jgi:hypothetical protein